MDQGTKQTIGWGTVIVGILVGLTAIFSWPVGWQYVWAAAAIVLGVWEAFAPRAVSSRAGSPHY